MASEQSEQAEDEITLEELMRVTDLAGPQRPGELWEQFETRMHRLERHGIEFLPRLARAHLALLEKGDARVKHAYDAANKLYRAADVLCEAVCNLDYLIEEAAVFLRTFPAHQDAARMIELHEKATKEREARHA